MRPQFQQSSGSRAVCRGIITSKDNVLKAASARAEAAFIGRPSHKSSVVGWSENLRAQPASLLILGYGGSRALFTNNY